MGDYIIHGTILGTVGGLRSFMAADPHINLENISAAISCMIDTV